MLFFSKMVYYISEEVGYWFNEFLRKFLIFSVGWSEFFSVQEKCLKWQLSKLLRIEFFVTCCLIFICPAQTTFQNVYKKKNSVKINQIWLNFVTYLEIINNILMQQSATISAPESPSLTQEVTGQWSWKDWKKTAFTMIYQWDVWCCLQLQKDVISVLIEEVDWRNPIKTRNDLCSAITAYTWYTSFWNTTVQWGM